MPPIVVSMPVNSGQSVAKGGKYPRFFRAPEVRDGAASVPANRPGNGPR